MELENIVANTVLLKAREGTATPAALPGAVPAPRRGCPRHAASLQPPPDGSPGPGYPPHPPPWTPRDPSIRGVGGWVGSSWLASTRPNREGTAAPVLRDVSVRPSYPSCRPKDVGQRI